MNILDRLRQLISALQVFWKEWNLRSFVIASFTFQLVLILIGPFRKQTSNGLVILSIWFSYLLADWVAIQAIGLISKTPGNHNANESQNSLSAFWAQFLLLHIGGPDTITALAIEDNELWLRTALHLGVQVYATLGVLVKSVQGSSLWVPTILMFLSGVIKYVERAMSLLKGRLTSFDDESDDYTNLLKANEPEWDDELPPVGIEIDDKGNKESTDVDMVRHAFYFFHYYKGLYAGHIFGYDELRKCKSYFLLRTTAEAFKLLEIELNFAYQVFYTKTVIVHKKIGKVLRPITILFEVICLVFWCISEKDGFRQYDIRVTYTLLVGAIAVDVLAIFRIQLSDWNIPYLRKNSSIRRSLFNKLLSSQNRSWGRFKNKEEAPKSTWLRRAFFRRWSETIPQFNLINFCVDVRSPKTQKAIEFFSLKDVLDKNRYVSKKWFFDDLRDHIVKWLHPGSLVISRLVGVGSFTRLDWSDWFKNYIESMGLESEDYSGLYNMKLEETLIGWHILTEVCYRAEVNDNEDHKDMESDESSHQDEEKRKVYRELSKVLSDYLLYLLIWQPNALPLSSGSSKRTFRDTCGRVKDMLKTNAQVLSLDSEVPRELIIEPSPVLAHTFDLERMLSSSMKMKSKEMWKFMAGLWMLMLCYTAKHCKPDFYAARLKEGGELLSFVWLLMAHYGIGQIVGH